MTGPLLVVSWVRFHGRSADLADRLGGEAVFFPSRLPGGGLTAPLRWAGHAVATVRLLATRRPRGLVVMAPPYALVLVALAFRLLTGRPTVVDAHTGALRRVRRGGTPHRPLLAVARWFSGVVVTNAPLAALPAAAGARVLVLHDPVRPAARQGGTDDGPVVFPATWAPDEPMEDVRALAEHLAAHHPGVDLVVTGRRRGAAAGWQWPANVVTPGYLPDADYADLLGRARLVLALTTREDTMQRAGYEALAAGVPVVASGTQALRGFFTRGAVMVDGQGGAPLAAAVDEALRRRDELAGAMPLLRQEREQEAEATLAELGALLSPDPSGGRRRG